MLKSVFHNGHWLFLSIDLTTLQHHFHNTSTTLPKHFHITFTSLPHHLHKTYTSLPQHLHNTSTSLPQHFHITSQPLPHIFHIISTSLPQHFHITFQPLPHHFHNTPVLSAALCWKAAHRLESSSGSNHGSVTPAAFLRADQRHVLAALLFWQHYCFGSTTILAALGSNRALRQHYSTV